MATRLPETSLYWTFPSQPRPVRRSEQKVRGQQKEACVYFLVSRALGKLYLGWSVGYAGRAPCCHGPLVLLVILIRMMSFSEAPFQHVPSTLPPESLHGPCRPRALVTSQSPQTPDLSKCQAPFVDLNWFCRCHLL